MPYWWEFEQLAMEWHKAPYEIERELADPLVQGWVIRGMLFRRLAAVEVRRGH